MQVSHCPNSEHWNTVFKINHTGFYGHHKCWPEYYKLVGKKRDRNQGKRAATAAILTLIEANYKQKHYQHFFQALRQRVQTPETWNWLNWVVFGWVTRKTDSQFFREFAREVFFFLCVCVVHHPATGCSKCFAMTLWPECCRGSQDEALLVLCFHLCKCFVCLFVFSHSGYSFFAITTPMDTEFCQTASH